MKTNIRLNVTDGQRNALARLLAGKDVKRLATREEVFAYVQGAIDCLAPPTPAAIDTVTVRGEPYPAPVEWRARPSFDEHVRAGSLKESDWPSYARGWNARPYRSA